MGRHSVNPTSDQTSESSGAAISRDPLLQPFRLRHLTLRNRIMSTSHAATLDGTLPMEHYQRYHEEKAKGGLALTMFGGSSMVSPDSNWGGSQMDVSTDEVIPWLQQFSERIHRHGAALMVQISHLGRRADSTAAHWLPNVAPSHLRETGHRSFARAMDMDDIRRVVRQFGEAARRCKEGGLDGIETLAGGHLIGQFLSPLTNRRTDGFGGSIENRVRFALMVHEEIRRQAGDDFIAGIRYVIDEDDPEGLTFDDAVRAAQILEAEGVVDFFNCIFGRFDTELTLLTYNIPAMIQKSAPWLEAVGRFRRHVKSPVFHAAKIADLATARHALREGVLDMVGMTRAHIADPQIVNKLLRGEEDRIRPCVGASHCLYRRVACIHNAATGREVYWPQVIRPAEGGAKRAVVVGGGPAGLEAARILAERGHRVTLFEAAARLGGQLLLAGRASFRRDLLAIVGWRERELERLGVEVRLNAYAGPQDVLALEPDLVIVATGGLPDLDWIDGAEHCTSVWDVLADPQLARPGAVIWDGTGRHPAPSAALELAESGLEVTLVAFDPHLAPEMEYQSRVTYRKRLAETGVPLLFEYGLAGVRSDGNQLEASFQHQLTGEVLTLRTPQLIVEHGTLPLTEVYDGLRERSGNAGATDMAAVIEGRAQPPVEKGRFALYRIGDVVTSRSVHAAVYDALRICAYA